MSNRPKHPSHRAYDRARKRMLMARAVLKDDGMYPMRDTARRLAEAEMRRAEDRFEKAQAIWRAAGRPS